MTPALFFLSFFLVATYPAAAFSEVTFQVKTTSLGKTAPGLYEESLTVSPDGKRVAYVAGDVATDFLLGRPARPWHPLSIIPAEGKGRLSVVVDGVSGPPYLGVAVPVFSPDGRRVAYAARRKGGLGFEAETIVSDGTEGRRYLEVGRPVFSADSRHLAYRARDFDDQFPDPGPFRKLVLDGSVKKAEDAIATDLIFSPDSQRIAYIEVRKRNEVVAVDGSQATSGGTAQGAGDPAFSPDGRRLVYKANVGHSFFVIADGKRGPIYDRIGLLVFRPDGRLGYAARRGTTSFVIIEGSDPQEYPRYPRVGDPVFSPDGGHLAYWAGDGKSETVIRDGVAGKTYDEIGTLVFGPDGRHLAYEARVGAEWRLVVDGAEGPVYSPPKTFPVEREWRPLYRNGWRFEGPTLLSHVGVRDGEIVRWEVSLAAR